MVVVAFALRFGWIVVAHTYKFKTFDDNFSFGWEMGRIGRSLAQGQGFSNPFSATTGPTAWEPPLYPFLIAGVFKLFGIYTHASALVLLGINSLFSALTCIPIFLIAKRCFSEKLAIWTAWLWAVMPPVMYWCTRWVWETSLAALLLALIFWLTLDLEERDGLIPWIRVRTVLGDRGADQHFPAGVSAGFRTVGVVPALEARQAFAGWGCAVGAGIRRLHRALDGTESPSFGSDVSALELRRRTAHRKRPGSGWDVERISSSHAECLPDAPLPRDGRSCLR